MNRRVEVDLADVRRQIAINRQSETMIEFVPVDRRGPDAVAASDRAVIAANESVSEDWGGDPCLSNDGVTFRLVAWEDEGLPDWLDRLAAHLSSEGYAGVVGALPMTDLPGWFYDDAQPCPTAYLAFDGAYAAEDPGSVAWSDRLAGWVAAGGGRGVVVRRGFVQSVPPREAGVLLREPPRPTSTALIYPGESVADPTAREVSVGRDGETVAQTRLRDLDGVRALLIGLAEYTRLGFVAMTGMGAYNWDRRAQPPPRLPTIGLNFPIGRPELWSRYVPDAHVMQVLSNGHIARIGELSMWRTTDLPGGRLLVEARDPGPWLQSDGPDADTLHRARQSFADLMVPAEAAR
jgi:hypothetical protein